MNLDVRPIGTSPESLEQTYDFLRLVFPNAHHFSLDYLKWQYRDNPIGQVVGADVFDADKQVAHYALLPLRGVINGIEEKALLSLNVGSHPGYRGKGLFKIAGDKAIEYAQERGYQHIVAVCNNGSTAIFEKHFGYQVLGPLDVRIGIGNMATSAFDCDFKYKINWSESEMAWRLKRPNNRYFSVVKNDQQYIYTATAQHAYCCIGRSETPVDLPEAPTGFKLNPLRMWIGLNSTC
jgi:GNAT superfamily N-acetyltransferase